jgi:hypothetical protein
MLKVSEFALYQGIALAIPKVVQNQTPLQGLQIGIRVFHQPAETVPRP